MKITIFLFLFSFQVFSSVCDETGTFEKPSTCLGGYTKEDIGFLLTDKDETKKFCQENCLNQMLNAISTDPKQIKIEQSGMILDQVQKEITALTLDLMKLRSGIEIPGNSTGAIKECNLSKISIPSCLQVSANAQVQRIQNSLATEIANILNGSNNSNGLFLRQENKAIQENQCEANEKNILLSSFLYSTEDIVTPEILEKDLFLKKSGLREDTYITRINNLKSNPLIKTVLETPTLLQEFKKLSSPEEKKKFLFSTKVSQTFFDSMEKSCKDLISQTTTALKKLDCSPNTPNYAFKNLDDYQIKNNITFESLANDEDAEKHLQKLCSQINAENNSRDITDLIKEVTVSNDRSINKSLHEFKIQSFQDNIFSKQDMISKARKTNPLDPNSTEAKLLNACESLTKDENYVELAKGSNENINKILRSMIGDGVPQKDGKEDKEAVVVLIKEGILPDPKNEIKPTPATSVAKFDEKVRNSTSSSTTVKQASIKPNVNSAAASSSHSQEYSQDYTQPMANVSGNSAREIAVDETTDNEVRNLIPRMDKLSQNQKDLLNDFAKRQNSIKGSKSNKASNEAQVANLPSMGMGSSLNNSASLEESQQPSSGKPFEHEGTAKLSDDKRVKDSFNDALNRANESRSPASLSNAGASVSLSTSGAEKVVDIKVPEQNLLVVENFKNELKNLLELKDSEFSVIQAGETILVKINNYEVKVIFDKKSGQYIARCDDEKFPDSYEEVIKNYFNKTLLKDRARRSELVKSLPN